MTASAAIFALCKIVASDAFVCSVILVISIDISAAFSANADAELAASCSIAARSLAARSSMIFNFVFSASYGSEALLNADAFKRSTSCGAALFSFASVSAA